jgi:putative sterol carrier protein
VIAGIFRQMPRQLKASAAKTDATVRWDITAGSGDAETWYAIFADGRCRTTREAPAENPRTTFTVDALDFIRLAAGAENPMAMFQNGRIKISGDLFFAAQVQSMFAIPA